MLTKKTLIVGLGQTGLSCVRYLHGQRQPFMVYDTRDKPPGFATLKADYPAISVYLQHFPEQQWQQVERVFLSPGVSIQHAIAQQAKARDIPILGDVELFLQHVTVPIIAITGTNGKSTVTALVTAMAQQAGMHAVAAGNIGQPVLDFIDQPNVDVYVLELSSFQLETIHSLQYHIATILNISQDHLDHHESWQHYLAAKQCIYQRADCCVFNRDDSATYPKNYSATHYSFALNKPMNARDFGYYQEQLMCGDMPWLSREQLPYKQKTHIVNVLAAFALGSALGLPKADMVAAAIAFKGLTHRLQLVAKIDGVSWYNDSKATNVGATLAALQALSEQTSGRLILIAGGDAKEADLSPLHQVVQRWVSTVLIFGKDVTLLSQALAQSAPIIPVKDLRQAVQQAKQIAQNGDTVVLSPACASWDMFTNYQQRGEQFMQFVKTL